MAAGDKFINCDNSYMPTDALFRSMVVQDSNGNPALRTYETNASGGGGGGGGDASAANQILQLNALAPNNSIVTEEYFTGANNAATIAALGAWKAVNTTKKIIETIPMNGNDGVNGIMIRWIA